MTALGDGVVVEIEDPIPTFETVAPPGESEVLVLPLPGPQGKPGAGIYVSMVGWPSDPANPENGGNLPADVLVLERIGA